MQMALGPIVSSNLIVKLLRHLKWRDGPAIDQPVGGGLPPEILELILSHLSTQEVHWKAKLLTVCRLWHIVATPFLYEHVEPLSMRAMSLLRSTIVRRPALANHIRTLIFPWLDKTADDKNRFFEFHPQTWRSRDQPEIYNARWFRLQRASEGQEDTFLPHRHSYVFLHHGTVSQLVKWFIYIAVRCTRLKRLQIPSVGFDLSPREYSSLLGSVETLILIKWPFYRTGHIKGDIINHACNVETLIICGHIEPNHKKLGFRPFVDSSVLPKLRALHLERFASNDLAKEIFKYHGSKLRSVCLWPESRFWLPPSSEAYKHIGHVKHLTIIALHQISVHSISPLHKLASLTHLELHADTLSVLYGILNNPPHTLQLLVISNLASTNIAAYIAHDPFLLAHGLLGYATADGIISRARMLESLTLRWRARKETLRSWKIITFCLHNTFKRYGIHFQMDFVIGPESVGLEWLRGETPGDRHRWIRSEISWKYDSA